MIMTTLTRQEVLNILQGDWAAYVQQFRRLSPEAQSTFLVKQGYARFADLLAHIIAWWEVGYHTIGKYISDPGFRPIEYDVDAFNAKAVAKVGELDEDDVIDSFEKKRSFLIYFVETLPDTAFQNEKVVNQFNMELVGHLRDHKIPEIK
jgi:hypothetical protein